MTCCDEHAAFGLAWNATGIVGQPKFRHHRFLSKVDESAEGGDERGGEGLRRLQEAEAAVPWW